MSLILAASADDLSGGMLVEKVELPRAISPLCDYVVGVQVPSRYPRKKMKRQLIGILEIQATTPAQRRHAAQLKQSQAA